MEEFLDFRILDFLDIVFVAVLLYYLYKLVKGTVAVNIFIGIVIIYLISKLTGLLRMELLSSVLGQFIGAGMFALIVVFQQEIRKFLLMIGSTNFGARRRFLRQFKFSKDDEKEILTDVDAIVRACETMGLSKTGALIVIEKSTNLDFIKSSGDKMKIKVNQPIIESIFYKNSPLHDGAIVIEENYVTATRVILPVSNDRNIPLRFGLRHRAAVGITEKTDALALVVSEETGQISFIRDKEFVMYENTEDLIMKLKRELS